MAAIGIIGRDGRMGQAIAAAIEEGGHTLAGAVDKGEDVAGLADRSDVLIDFSAPAALEGNLHAAIGAGVPLLIGTTGLGERHHSAIDDAARAVPILARLVREAAQALGPDWDVEIVEMHHRRKVDAPSGTALLLGEAAAEARGIDLDTKSERGRDGIAGEREEGAIGFASLRGGTVTGEHSVILAGQNERIVLSHVAEDRALFARGALTGGAWLIGREPGRYSMENVLGL